MSRLSEADIQTVQDWATGQITLSAAPLLVGRLLTELRERRAAEAQPAGTVKVRIAVGIDHRGRWDASGGSGDCPDPTNTTGRFVTAYVPLPDPPAEVVGSVEVGDAD